MSTDNPAAARASPAHRARTITDTPHANPRASAQRASLLITPPRTTPRRHPSTALAHGPRHYFSIGQRLTSRGRELSDQDARRCLLYLDTVQRSEEGRERVGIIRVKDPADRQGPYFLVLDLDRYAPVAVELLGHLAQWAVFKDDLALEPGERRACVYGPRCAEPDPRLRPGSQPRAAAPPVVPQRRTPPPYLLQPSPSLRPASGAHRTACPRRALPPRPRPRGSDADRCAPPGRAPLRAQAQRAVHRANNAQSARNQY